MENKDKPQEAVLIPVLQTLSDSSAIEKAIKELSAKRIGEVPNVDEIDKQLDPNKHDVMDVVKRPNKRVKADVGDEVVGVKKVTVSGKEQTINLKEEKVSRIALGYQRLIVSRAVAFFFGIPVDYLIESEDAKELQAYKAVTKILHDNKEKWVNREIARELFAYTEVAELWFPVEKPNKSYGFDSKYKLKVISLKPSDKNELFPYFDATGDMIAFSRKFMVNEEDKKVEYYETYTDTKIYQFKKVDTWENVEGYPKENILGKIPIVYGRQSETEWAIVQNLIDSDESLRSDFSDTNKYHASPTMFIKGSLQGFAKKGETGKVIQGDKDSEAKYLAWSAASDSVKTEHQMNREDIFAITQTPDFSFNNVKDLGNLGVAAQKLLLSDAHMKVMDKEEILGKFLQRRINIILAFIAQFNNSFAEACENVMITPQITPYIMGDDKEKISNITTAVSGGIMSKKTGIEQLGWVTDNEKEFQQILDEEKQSNALDMFPPAQ